MINEQPSKVLIDNDTDLIIILLGSKKEGYELALKYVNSTQVIVELKEEPPQDWIGYRANSHPYYQITENSLHCTDNKDDQIALSKNKDIPLMNNVHIKTGFRRTPATLRYPIIQVQFSLPDQKLHQSLTAILDHGYSSH